MLSYSIKQRFSNKNIFQILKIFFKFFSSFWGILFLILCFRWLLFEPYVIPSGSMIPNLLINDHIIVNKLNYGIRYPFSKKLIWKRSIPKRGDVVVFRSVEDKKFMVKRVIGLPGEEIWIDDNNEVWVNNKKLSREKILDPKEKRDGFYSVRESDLGTSYSTYDFFLENSDGYTYRVMQRAIQRYSFFPNNNLIVPKDHIFVMGDNRDDSRDSRYFGTVPIGNVMGRVFGIWLTCYKTLPFLSILCNPFKLRYDRLFTKAR